MKLLIKLANLMLWFGLLTGCSGVSNKTLDYNEAQSMPGYGYITMDFSQSNEIAYGRGYIAGKTDYTIMYVNDGDALFVDVKNADFNGKTLKAYIPYYKNYKLRDVSRMVFYPCKDCSYNPQSYFVDVNLVSAVGGAWCQETIHKNLETFDYTDGCHNDDRDENGIGGTKKSLGSVFITPHFTSDFNDSFTNRSPSGHQSAGS